jgi:hypothetical protein
VVDGRELLKTPTSSALPPASVPFVVPVLHHPQTFSFDAGQRVVLIANSRECRQQRAAFLVSAAWNVARDRHVARQRSTAPSEFPDHIPRRGNARWWNTSRAGPGKRRAPCVMAPDRTGSAQPLGPGPNLNLNLRWRCRTGGERSSPTSDPRPGAPRRRCRSTRTLPLRSRRRRPGLGRSSARLASEQRG